MPKKIYSHITLDDLAGMVNHGFAEMASKRDLASVKEDVASVKEDVAAVKSLQKEMHEEMNAMHSDIRHIRSTVDALVRSDFSQDATIQDILARVHRLERKAGVAK